MTGVSDVLAGSYELIVTLVAAVAAFAAAIVGLLLLKYLVDTITGATAKVRRI
jgi:hypothetical protein